MLAEPREGVRPHRSRCLEHSGLTDDRARRTIEDTDGSDIVDDGRGAPPVFHDAGRTRALEQLGHHFADDALSAVPGAAIGAADRALQRAVGGDDIGSITGMDGSEDDDDLIISISRRTIRSAQPSPHLTRHRGGELGHHVHQVDGELGARGVAARSAHDDLDRVGGRGECSRAQADLAEVDLGIAVQSKHVRRAGDPPLPNDLHGTSGDRLLTRFEDQAHGARHGLDLGECSQHEPGAEHYGGVGVVTARVRDTFPPRAVLRGGAIRHSEGIDVGSQHDHGPGRIAGHVTDQARADFQHLRVQPRDLQAFRDGLRGGVLGVGRLGIGVQAAAEGDEFMLPRRGEGSDRGAHVAETSAAIESASSARSARTTPCRSPPSATTRR